MVYIVGNLQQSKGLSLEEFPMPLVIVQAALLVTSHKVTIDIFHYIMTTIKSF